MDLQAGFPDEYQLLKRKLDMATDFRGERLDIYTVEKEDLAEHLVRYNFASNKSRGIVLDLACGVGYGSFFLCSNQAVERVVGADISKTAVEYASNTFVHGKLAFAVESATKTTFSDASFDTIVSLETVEHLKDVEPFFNEVKRLLRPRGTLILSVPNKKYFIDAGFENEFHFNEMYFKEISAVLSQSFGQVELYYQHYPRERYDRIRPGANPQKGPNGGSKFKQLIPRAIKKLGRALIQEIEYRKAVKKSIPRQYGFDFNRFLLENKSLCDQYIIEPIAGDIYDRIPGNFIAVWHREGVA